MSYYSVDVEADGQVPGLNGSMVCFGAVLIDDKLDKIFYGQTKPIINTYNPEALAVSGFTREEHEQFNDPFNVMQDFNEWIKSTSQGLPIFISDNPAFDFAYINYYFHKYVGTNPFGWSGRRLGDLYCGFHRDSRFRWKKFRDAPHNHNPISDALGNAQALLKLRDNGLNIKLK